MQPWFEATEKVLRALGNVNRLRLLDLLQVPRSYAELSLSPSRGPSRGTSTRAISRQAIRRHLDPLLELGIVVRLEGNGREPRYVVDRARLYAELDRLRRLEQVRADVELDGPEREVDPPFRVEPPDAPHLVLLRGADEGRVFPLHGREALIGRKRALNVSLDYDPGVSPIHARVRRLAGGIAVTDAGSRNGTWLNWRRIPAEREVPLRHGDVLGVGTSLLLFREDEPPLTRGRARS